MGRVVLGLVLGGLLLAVLRLVVAPDASYRFHSWTALGRYSRYDGVLRAVADEAKLEPELLKAIAWKASGLNARSVGADGARGLFRISEATAREWAAAMRIESFMLTDLFDALTNARVAAWVLSRGLDRWKEAHDPELFVLVEFMKGRPWFTFPAPPKKVDLLVAEPPATREFVEAVRKRRDFYKRHGL